MNHAPLALFVYKRPDHTARTIAALKACDGFAETMVTVFSDGPRAPGDAAAVAAVRAVVARDLPAARCVAAPANCGLAASIIAGTTALLAEHERVIVVEDDLLVAPDFLTFMNAGLERYADEPRVMQISGFLPDLHRPFETGIFLPQTSSWTWATWARAWRLFNPVPVELERLKDAAFRRRFNRNGTYNYVRALEAQIAGRTDSWAVRWYWSVFKCGGLIFYPPRSLVTNIGFDGSGTHSSRGVSGGHKWRDPPLPLSEALVFPRDVAVDPVMERRVNLASRRQVRNPVALARALIAKLLIRR